MKGRRELMEGLEWCEVCGRPQKRAHVLGHKGGVVKRGKGRKIGRERARALVRAKYGKRHMDDLVELGIE
jgi:hypothetical protein